MTRWNNPSPRRKYDDIMPEVIKWMRKHKQSATMASRKFNIPLGTLYRKLGERT